MAWLTGYGYRQKVPLKRVDGAVTDYQMLLTVNKGVGDSSGAVIYLKDHALSWGGTVPNDLRFTTADEVTELPYWIESSDANTAKVWGKYNSIGTTDTYFCVYYGKSGDTTTSNGGNTFLFFENWENTRHASWVDGARFSATDWEYAAPGLRDNYRLHFKTGRIGDEYDNMWWEGATFDNLRLLALVRTDYSSDDSQIMARCNGNESGNYYAAPGYCVVLPQDNAQYFYLTYQPTSGARSILTSLAAVASTNTVRIEFLLYGTSLLANIERPPGTSLGQLSATDVTYASGYVGLGATEWLTDRNPSFDAMAVGKYVSPEPTWGTWGTEELAGFPHSTGFTIG